MLRLLDHPMFNLLNISSARFWKVATTTAAGQYWADSFTVETAGHLFLHDFLLAFVKTGVIPGVVPRHHEIFECFVLNYNAISVVTNSNNRRVTDHQLIQDLVNL